MAPSRADVDRAANTIFIRSGYAAQAAHESLIWETDPSLRANELPAAFADTWCALPKVVFSRTLDHVQGNARLAERPLAEEVAAVLAATDRDVEIGGAGLAAAAVEQRLVSELRIFRNPVIVGGGTPLLPPVADAVAVELVETRTFGSRVVYERYRLPQEPLNLTE
jgi:riboflavin biosynthesis pyrimidine reductase